MARFACRGPGECHISTPAKTLTLERAFRGYVNQAHGLTANAAKPYPIPFEG